MAEAVVPDVSGLQLLLAHDVGHLGFLIVFCIAFRVAET
jgi:hypothetical protein